MKQVLESRRHRLLRSASRRLVDEEIAIGVVLGVVFAKLLADLPYTAVNPRIRYQ